MAYEPKDIVARLSERTPTRELYFSIEAALQAHTADVKDWRDDLVAELERLAEGWEANQSVPQGPHIAWAFRIARDMVKGDF